MKSISAFTLIEVVLVIALVGILAAVAYPSYIHFVIKSHRTDALATLAQDQIALERCYAQHFAYNQTCSFLPSFPQTSTQGYYSITLSDLGTTTYTLTATAIGNQTTDKTCTCFTVNHAHVKTAMDSSGRLQSTCWNP